MKQITHFFERWESDLKVNNRKTTATPQTYHSDIFMVMFAEISRVCVCASSLLTLTPCMKSVQIRSYFWSVLSCIRILVVHGLLFCLLLIREWPYQGLVLVKNFNSLGFNINDKGPNNFFIFQWTTDKTRNNSLPATLFTPLQFSLYTLLRKPDNTGGIEIKHWPDMN